MRSPLSRESKHIAKTNIRIPVPESKFMKTVTLILTRPVALAAEAGQAGLLTPESLATLLRREVRQRIDNLF
jgi:hypothetical protein